MFRYYRELKYVLGHLDSDNVSEIDANKTRVLNLEQLVAQTIIAGDIVTNTLVTNTLYANLCPYCTSLQLMNFLRVGEDNELLSGSTAM